MNEIIQDFVDTLRDPQNPEKNRNYKETYRILRDNNNCFCAEGVLCDIMAKRFPKKYSWSKKPINGHYMFRIENIWSSEELAEYVFETKMFMPADVLYDNGIKPDLTWFLNTEEIAEVLREAGFHKVADMEDLYLSFLNDMLVPWETIAQIVEILYTEKE